MQNNMAIARLEFESLAIHQSKERWNLYFILVTEHPTDEDKMVMRAFPDPTIRLTSSSENKINFEPKGEATNGYIVLERELPANETVRAQVFLRHSREWARDLGEVIQDVTGRLGDSFLGELFNIFNVAGPWVVIAKSAFGVVGDILRKVDDRDFGFLGLDQHFTAEFQDNVEFDRLGHFSTQQASLVWTWSVDR